MSNAEIERFIGDLKGNSALLDEVKAGIAGLSSVVDKAKAKGYDITMDDAKTYIAAQAGQELNDEQLDAVAGGKGHHHVYEGVQVVAEAVAVAAIVVT